VWSPALADHYMRTPPRDTHTKNRARRHAAALLAITLSITGALASVRAGAETRSRPKLVVVLVVDQMRADYLVRFAGLFVGGFRRLTTLGAVFTDAHQDHAATVTAVGHATLSTGMFPSHHGIAGNDWYDRTTRAKVASTIDAGHPVLTRPELGGRSPHNLMRTSLGDWLKAGSPRSKVFSIAFKDRSAILMGGQRPDGAFWYEHGAFVTSTYYARSLPGWVDAFNASGLIDAHFAEGWRKLLPEEAYFASSEDNVATENDGRNTTFPHLFDDGTPDARARYRDGIEDTPFGDELAIEFAKTLVSAERLGTDADPDLLWLSCSTSDHVGHLYGPLSQEVQDNYLRLDRNLGDLFDFLDAKVGAGEWVVALSADHGVLPLPEELRRRGIDAGRVPRTEFLKQVGGAANAVAETVGAGPDLVAYANYDGVVLNLPPSGRLRVPPAEVRRLVAERLRALPFVADTFTLEELESDEPGREFLDAFRRSYVHGRSADILFRFKPNYLVAVGAYGTTHGGPYRYDTHVPIVVAGAGVRPATHASRVRTVDLAPTLAEALGLALPADLDGRSLWQAVAAPR
jgi:predicted AlkP superfamily pyrophosphatase or phosphodiesterase